MHVIHRIQMNDICELPVVRDNHAGQMFLFDQFVIWEESIVDQHRFLFDGSAEDFDHFLRTGFRPVDAECYFTADSIGSHKNAQLFFG